MGRRGMGIKGINREENNLLWNNDGNVARMKKTTTSVLYK